MLGEELDEYDLPFTVKFDLPMGSESEMESDLESEIKATDLVCGKIFQKNMDTLAFICRIESTSVNIRSKFLTLEYLDIVNCLNKLEDTNLLFRYKMEFLKSKSTTFDFIRKLDCFCESDVITDSEMHNILTKLNYEK